MTRQNTPYAQSSPPRKLSSFSRTQKSAFKPFRRSPINSGYNHRVSRSPAAFSRLGRVKGNLSNIREESTELEDDRRRQDTSYRALNPTQADNSHQLEDDFEEEEDDMAEWDEESTLVAMMHNEIGDTQEDRLSALVNNLKTPINAQGVTLKQYLVQTLVPTAKKVKATHAAVESKVDVPFEAGLLAFNDASRKMENLAIREEDELKAAYAKTQNNIKKLFTQLEQAYTRRDQVYTEFSTALEQTVRYAKADLDALPGDVERTITALEKKSKDLEKNDNTSSKSKEKMLRELLNKF